MKNKFGRHALVQILMVLAVCLFCVCGQAQNENREETDIKKEVEIETELHNETEAAVNEALPDNDTIREDIYSYYQRESDEKISDEEVEAAKGKLPAYARTIHSGDEFALMRKWYNWDNARYARVVFSEELSDWREEDLEALKILTGTVFVESSAETFPARALTCLTGAEELIFSMDTDLSDVTGTLPDGVQISKQIKSVTLYDYR